MQTNRPTSQAPSKSPASSRPRILVVYYSRSGGTAVVAQRLAEALGCRIERIVDRTKRTGVLGWLRSALDGLLGRKTLIAPPSTDPSSYDLVVVGTPVWSSSLSSPVRTYLDGARGKVKRVAFFLTHGGSGRARVLSQMRDAVDRRPEGALAVTPDEITSGTYRRKVDELAAHLWAGQKADHAPQPAEWLGAANGRVKGSTWPAHPRARPLGVAS